LALGDYEKDLILLRKTETPPMELLLNCAEPALADACYRLIDLVDRVLKCHPDKAKPRRKLFSFYGFSGMSDRGLGISTPGTSQSYSSNSAILEAKTNAKCQQVNLCNRARS
jgi:hypothetical protein